MPVYTRRPHKKKHPLLTIFLILVFISAIFAVKMYLDGSLFSIFSQPIVTDGFGPAVYNSSLPNTGDESIAQALKRLAEDDDRISSVVSNMDDYPEPLLALLVSNYEARDFVLNYPEHRGDISYGTISKAELSAQIPYFLQWDSRWGYYSYGSCVLGVTGCGPTCLSMLVVGLTGNSDATPAAVAAFSETNGFYVEGSGTSWDLMTTGAESFGLSSSVIPLDEGSMVAELSSGNPIIISLGEGDFTTDGHFIVIDSYENGMFIIKDPNSPSKSGEGWYYTTLAPQIRNIWSYRAV